MRERAAAKQSRKTSQEKEHRLRARRERAALKRKSESPPEGLETNRRAQSRRESDTRRRDQREAIFEARRNEYLHNRGWAENHGLHHEEWAQEEMAASHRFEENLPHYPCVVCRRPRKCKESAVMTRSAEAHSRTEEASYSQFYGFSKWYSWETYQEFGCKSEAITI